MNFLEATEIIPEKKKPARWEPYQKPGQPAAKKTEEETPFGNPKLFWKVTTICI